MAANYDSFAVKDCCKSQSLRKLQDVTVIVKKGKLTTGVAFRGKGLWIMEPVTADPVYCQELWYCANCEHVHRLV